MTLVYDNGEGLEFRRTIAVDNKYLFTLKDEVVNKGAAPVTLYPYALISRHGIPPTLGYYIMHEGLIGVIGDKGLQEQTYAKMEEKKSENFDVVNAWLGFTDKYWAATLLPDISAKVRARFSFELSNNIKKYQTDYLLDPQTIAPGATATANARLFAGAKEVAVVDDYDSELKLNRFELLIDWGWFYFITKPMFLALDWIYRLVGNFGVAILIVTVLDQDHLLPARQQVLRLDGEDEGGAAGDGGDPRALRRRQDEAAAGDDGALQEGEDQSASPAVCPIVIQIPVFFSLYKVLFITIEMRHAPFFGWIKDLSAPDPTTVFNLFGLIPWDPTVVPLIGPFLHLGAWPLIMGVTMWFQMKLNPPPPDPTQKMIFNYMPIIFTFMLASFPAGLVIYWAWNNTLSVLQQSVIMHKHGAKIELWDNLKGVCEGRRIAKKKSVSGSSS